MKGQNLKINVKPSLTTTTFDELSEVQVDEICKAICHDNVPHFIGLIPLYNHIFGIWFCSKR